MFNGSFSDNNRVIFDAGTVTNGAFTTHTVAKGEDNQDVPNPDGFDFQITFSNAVGTSSTRFDGSDELTYILTCTGAAALLVCGPGGTNPLDATDFAAFNPDGLLAVGRIGTFNTTSGANIDGNGARYAAVPEPASLALFGIGLAGLGAMRRRLVAPV